MVGKGAERAVAGIHTGRRMAEHHRVVIVRRVRWCPRSGMVFLSSAQLKDTFSVEIAQKFLENVFFFKNCGKTAMKDAHSW
jgi:hypothetical protein